jgi:hypothetical protein
MPKFDVEIERECTLTERVKFQIEASTEAEADTMAYQMSKSDELAWDTCGFSVDWTTTQVRETEDVVVDQADA